MTKSMDFPGDEKFLSALRIPRLNRLNLFDACLQEHREHVTFQVQSWPETKELGFTCSCNGAQQEWRIDVQPLKELIPRTRERLASLMRSRPFQECRRNRRDRYKDKRIQRRAKSLLHFFLTRQQRWDLRATRSLGVVAQDGNIYRVFENAVRNVERIEPDGTVRYRFCLVFSNQKFPTYDLMLTLKVLLEADLETFLRTAHVSDEVTKQNYTSGRFLFTGENPPPPLPFPTILDVPYEVLENPETWIRERLGLP